MNMNLVTGGFGLVGSHLVKLLLEAGENVTTFSRSRGESREKEFNIFKGKWKHISGSLTSHADILNVIETVKPKTIYHLASMLAIPSEGNPRESVETNMIGMFNLLEAARLNNVEKFIFASSIATFGEEVAQIGLVDDKTIQRPIGIYGVTKVSAELLGRYFKRKYNLDFRCIRLPAVMGPGVKEKNVSVYNSWAVERAIEKVPYDIFVAPEIKCPIVYFKDAVRSFVELKNAPLENIKTVCYNIVGMHPVPSAGFLREKILQHIPDAQIGFKPEEYPMAHHSPRNNIRWDDSAAQEEWNWSIQYGMDAAIEDFIKIKI
jgi:threonine 3-dehydrogenase